MFKRHAKQIIKNPSVQAGAAGGLIGASKAARSDPNIGSVAFSGTTGAYKGFKGYNNAKMGVRTEEPTAVKIHNRVKRKFTHGY